MRQGEVEESDQRVVQEEVRFVVVHASQLAQQQAQASAAAPVQAAEAVADHVRQVHTRWCACRPDAAAAIAEYEGRGQGRRGRQPRPWRYHTLRYGIVAESRRTRRARRGRPAKTDPAPTESGYRLVAEVEVLRHPEEDHGWPVRATTARPEARAAAEVRPAYRG